MPEDAAAAEGGVAGKLSPRRRAPLTYSQLSRVPLLASRNTPVLITHAMLTMPALPWGCAVSHAGYAGRGRAQACRRRRRRPWAAATACTWGVPWTPTQV
jgi:hypothetical protein